MTSSQGNAEHAVAALFIERQRYEGWLGALTAKREATPAHIFERVHADYDSRLQRVVEQLRVYRPALQEMENVLVDRLTSLDIEEAKQRDERAETELRVLVGEFVGDQCEQVIRRCDAALLALGQERAKVSAEMSRIRGILDGVSGGPAPSYSASVSGGYAVQSAIDNVNVSSNGHAHVGASDDGQDGFDELRFLNSVVEATSGEHARIDEAPALASPVSSGPQRSVTPASLLSHSQDYLVAEVLESAPVSLDSGRFGGQSHQAGTAFVKDLPAEQVKSLKCQECNTLNYPTEWYCERCGAELAAL